MKTLNIHLNHPAERALNTFGATLQNLEAGQAIAPHFSIGFETVSQFAKVFTEQAVKPLPLGGGYKAIGASQ